MKCMTCIWGRHSSHLVPYRRERIGDEETTDAERRTRLNKNTVKPVLNGISRVQNIFPLKPGFRLIKVYNYSHGT
jgi:hypothetical protein